MEDFPGHANGENDGKLGAEEVSIGESPEDIGDGPKDIASASGQQAADGKTADIMILRGAEVDIASPEGYLLGIGLPKSSAQATASDNPFLGDEELFERAGGELDFFIASISKKLLVFHMTMAQATDAIIKAMEDPRVLMLGHAGRYELPIDVGEIVRASKALNKPIEINEFDYKSGTDTAGRYMEIALKCAEESCDICVNSDAHRASDVGEVRNAEVMLSAISFPKEQIINRNSSQFLERYRLAGFGLK